MIWNIEELKLPLKFTWKISRNSSDEKTNFLIRLNDNGLESLGEIAPNVRYGETHELILSQFNNFKSKYNENIKTIEDFTIFLDSLNLFHSLRFGLESAYINLICKKQNIHPAQYFGLNLPNKLNTSFSVPIVEISEIKEFISSLKRFESLKIKVNSETGLEMVKEVVKYTDQKLRIDGNEAWNDVNELIKFIENIKSYNIEFIEQPMPSKLVEEYKYLKKLCPFDLIADESIEDKGDFSELKQQFHGVNMKLMKAGGYINGLKILNEARKNDLKTMIGCMIETSLGIYSAYNLSDKVDYLDLDGFLIVKDEPFKLLKESNGALFL
ncbi:MAG: enolase C-terminal domain-like protein [Candidatus Sericytochromatia bacterium]